MTQPTEFTADMIKGNNITWTEKASITKKNITISINRYKKDLCNIWITTPTTANRVNENLTAEQAIKAANKLLKTL